MKRRQPAGEPLVQLWVDGVTHLVPESRLPLERLIERGIRLQRQLQAIAEERDAHGRETTRLMEAYRAEVKRLEDQLAQESAPYTSQMVHCVAELGQVQEAIMVEARSFMGEQRTLRYAGAAGTIEVERKLDVQILDGAKLRRALGRSFSTYFQVQARISKLASVWDLVRQYKGNLPGRLAEALRVTETGSVRFIPPGK